MGSSAQDLAHRVGYLAWEGIRHAGAEVRTHGDAGVPEPFGGNLQSNRRLNQRPTVDGPEIVPAQMVTPAAARPSGPNLARSEGAHSEARPATLFAVASPQRWRQSDAGRVF